MGKSPLRKTLNPSKFGIRSALSRALVSTPVCVEEKGKTVENEPCRSISSSNSGTALGMHGSSPVA
jgi:hypothetical protein